MATSTLDTQKMNLIRIISNTQRAETIHKLTLVLRREEPMSFEDEYIEPTREQLLAELDQAMYEAKLAKEGKLKGRPAEELLNEL